MWQVWISLVGDKEELKRVGGEVEIPQSHSKDCNVGAAILQWRAEREYILWEDVITAGSNADHAFAARRSSLKDGQRDALGESARLKRILAVASHLNLHSIVTTVAC